MERVDALSGLLDLAADNLRDELGGELGEGAGGGLALDDLGHLAADGTDLGRGGVGGLLDLVGPALGEGNGEEAEEVVVGGHDGDVGLNQSLPLADERAELVRGEVETVEVGQAVLALDLIDAELDLAESMVLVLLEIGEGDLENAALEGIVGVLQTGGAVDQGLADTDRHVRMHSFEKSNSPSAVSRARAVCVSWDWVLTLGWRTAQGPIIEDKVNFEFEAYR